MHGDLHAQNILLQLELRSQTVKSIALIDWAGARMGGAAEAVSIIQRVPALKRD